MDLVQTRRVWMAGRHPGVVPFRPTGFWGRFVLLRLLFRLAFHRILTIDTPVGRKVRAKGHAHGQPLIRQRPAELAAAGVECVPRVAGVRDGRPLLADGRVLDVANVVWCTGFDPGLSWIDLPIFDANGDPRHEAGVVREAPGLYFVGQHFLYSFSSAMIHGVGRDARRIAAAVAAR
jgi:putative flavoprotein involved in K+ transport